jgi:sugar phosphate isomerase/epimerase
MSESHTGLPHLALSASVYEHLALPDALSRIAELGYEAVELVADQPHFFPAHWTMGQALRLARSVEAEGLRVVNVSCETGRGFFSPIPAGPVYEPSMITPQLAGRRLRMQHLRRCLDLAFTLGAPCITVASGACLPGVPPAMAWEHLNEALTVLLSHAEELGVLVAIAPRPGHLIGHTEDALALLEALPHPLLGVSLDTAQLTVQGEPLQAAFMACADRTWTVQLTDAKRPSPYRLRPGQGDVDWRAVSDVLRAIGYQGPCTLHLENYVDTPDMAAQHALDDAGRMLRGLMPVA